MEKIRNCDLSSVSKSREDKILLKVLKILFAPIKWTALGLLALCAIGALYLIPESFFGSKPKQGVVNGRW